MSGLFGDKSLEERKAGDANHVHGGHKVILINEILIGKKGVDGIRGVIIVTRQTVNKNHRIGKAVVEGVGKGTPRGALEKASGKNVSFGVPNFLFNGYAGIIKDGLDAFGDIADDGGLGNDIGFEVISGGKIGANMFIDIDKNKFDSLVVNIKGNSIVIAGKVLFPRHRVEASEVDDNIGLIFSKVKHKAIGGKNGIGKGITVVILSMRLSADSMTPVASSSQ